MSEACENCRFAGSQSVDRLVECRRFPPAPHYSGGVTADRFPYVLRHEVCGEYQPSEAKNASRALSMVARARQTLQKIRESRNG